MADIALAEAGRIDHAEDWRVCVEKGDQGDPMGKAANEGSGSVDRIQAPAIASFGTVLVAKLLAGHAMPRIRLKDERAHRCLGIDVGRGHRVVCTGRRSEEHTSEFQSLMRISYAVFCLKKT